MKKPFAYVTAVWKGGEFTVIDQATVYCRKVYEAGFTPLCPVLYKRPCLLTENYCEYGVTHLSAVAAVPQFYWQPGTGLNTPVSGIEQTGSPAV